MRSEFSKVIFGPVQAELYSEADRTFRSLFSSQCERNYLYLPVNIPYPICSPFFGPKKGLLYGGPGQFGWICLPHKRKLWNICLTFRSKIKYNILEHRKLTPYYKLGRNFSGWKPMEQFWIWSIWSIQACWIELSTQICDISNIGGVINV